jgi:hypothetical protein
LGHINASAISPTIIQFAREMETGFQCDVFLSHSAKDKAVVWSRVERLRQDGLKL